MPLCAPLPDAPAANMRDAAAAKTSSYQLEIQNAASRLAWGAPGESKVGEPLGFSFLNHKAIQLLEDVRRRARVPVAGDEEGARAARPAARRDDCGAADVRGVGVRAQVHGLLQSLHVLRGPD